MAGDLLMKLLASLHPPPRTQQEEIKSVVRKRRHEFGDHLAQWRKDFAEWKVSVDMADSAFEKGGCVLSIHKRAHTRIPGKLANVPCGGTSVSDDGKDRRNGRLRRFCPL